MPLTATTAHNIHGYHSLCTCHVILIVLVTVTTELAAEEPSGRSSQNEHSTHSRNRYQSCLEVRNWRHCSFCGAHIVVCAATSRRWRHNCFCCRCCWKKNYQYKNISKFVPVLAMKAYWGSAGISPLILKPGTRWGEWSDACSSLFSLRANFFWTGHLGAKRVSCRCWQWNNHSLDIQSIAWSLYRRRYSETMHALFHRHQYDGHI